MRITSKGVLVLVALTALGGIALGTLRSESDEPKRNEVLTEQRGGEYTVELGPAGARHVRGPTQRGSEQKDNAPSWSQPSEERRISRERHEELLELIRKRLNDSSPSPTESVSSREDTNAAIDVTESHSNYIQESLKNVTPLLRECYELASENYSLASGDLTLSFSIEGDPEVGGVVSASEVTGGSLAENRQLVECVQETIYTLELEPPEHGGAFNVEYPITFAAGEESEGR